MLLLLRRRQRGFCSSGCVRRHTLLLLHTSINSRCPLLLLTTDCNFRHALLLLLTTSCNFRPALLLLTPSCNVRPAELLLLLLTTSGNIRHLLLLLLLTCVSSVAFTHLLLHATLWRWWLQVAAVAALLLLSATCAIVLHPDRWLGR
jgi:hypothetical protein